MKAFAGRILIIVQNLPVPFDRRVWLQAQTLRDNGYRVSVICPKSTEYPKSREVKDGISIYRYSMPIEAVGIAGYIAEFIYAWMASALLSLVVLLREGFDTLQLCNPPDTYFLLGLFYRLLGKEFIFDHHDLSPEMYLAKYHKKDGVLHKGLLLLERFTLRTAKLVMVTNESYKEVAIRRGRKKAEDVFVLRTGPDLNRLEIKPVEEKLRQGRRHLVCYLGEMCPQDGIDYLLRSTDHLINVIGRKDVFFILIGGGPAMKKFKAMSEKMGLSGSVMFTGRISDEDICRYLSAADLCVDPDPWSEWADSSTMNKILEYMTFGKAIVTYDLKETRVSAQKAAVYIKPNDYKMFSLEIHKLLSDSARRRVMGQFGLELVRKKLAWQHTHKALLQAYARLFNRTVVQQPVRDQVAELPALRLESVPELAGIHEYRRKIRPQPHLPEAVEMPVDMLEG